MRIPSSVFDKALLDDEPFSSGFLALGSGDSRRSRKLEINSFLDDMTAGLKADEILAADAWILMAFEACSSEGEKREVGPSLETRRVFVNFYWNLSKHNLDLKADGAANFLRQELSKRGYHYTPVELFCPATTQRDISRRKLRSSCQFTSGTKTEVLGVKTRLKKSSRAENIKHSGAGFKGAKTLSDRFSGPLKVDLQTKSLMSQKQKTLSHSPVARSRQGTISFPVTPELLESSERPAMFPFNEQYSAMRNSMDLSPPVMDVCTDPNQENKPTIFHEQGGISMSSPEMLLENIDTFPPTTSPSPLADGFRSELMLDTTRDGGPITPHISVPPTTCEIFSDGTSLLKDIESKLEEPAHIPTSNDVLVQTTLCLSTVKPPLPCYPPIWAQARYLQARWSTHNITWVSDFSCNAISSWPQWIYSGGKAESAHRLQGRSITHAADDQLAQDKSIRALLTNYRESRPLVLLIDDKYALFPYDLRSKAITYAVLGFYTISHAWG
ncbi:hypothetical protein C0992_000741 [Termitomyces sp. T32_za158]|nr:hypothetical protein C0992_000741 [Termitomyces sp. T32_za158]